MIVPDVGGGFGSKGTLPVETPLVALAAQRARPPGQVGRGPARELPRRAAGPRACARRSSSRSTPTAASSRLRGRLLADLGAYLLPSTRDPAAHDGDAAGRLLRHPGRRGDRHRRAHEQGPDRALPRRRPPRGDLPDRDDDRRRRARSWASTRSSCAAATSCASSRTGPRSAGPTTPATTSAAWTARSSCSSRRREPCRRHGRRADARRARRARRHRRRALRRALRRPVRVRRGHARTATGRRQRRLDPRRPGPRDAVRADRRRPARHRRRRGRRVRTGDTRRDRRRASARSPAARRRWAARRSPPACDDLLARGRATGAARASPPSRSSPPAPTPRSSRSSARPAQVRVRRLVAVDDAGRIVNPLLAEGQVIGGAVQGLGACLTEEVVHDEDGQPRSLAARLRAADRGRDPAVRDRVRRVAVAAEPARREGRSARAARSARPPAIANALADALGGATSTRRSPPRRSGGRCNDLERTRPAWARSRSSRRRAGRRRLRRRRRARGGRRRHRHTAILRLDGAGPTGAGPRSRHGDRWRRSTGRTRLHCSTEALRRRRVPRPRSTSWPRRWPARSPRRASPRAA